ncbi:hypothetical protein Sjap_025373 [Stephania japonica]|uniref:FAS1 domain-containing protein n=1 Tax=Stephania japonica TaxID=461633 RepID=A0AAP0E606_9MAGN
MAVSRTCSHWWHAPIYFVVTVTLAIVAITTSSSSSSASHHHHHHNPSTNPNTPPHQQSPIPHSAIHALRRRGFNFMATLLHLSPDLFLHSSRYAHPITIFAIHDSAFLADLSLPPWLLAALIHYHTSPSNLTFADLQNHPAHSCLPTLLPNKSLEITNIDRASSTVEINQVRISHPNIYLDRIYTIHGVLHQFIAPIDASIDLRRPRSADFIQNPQFCSPRSKTPNYRNPRKRSPNLGVLLPWEEIVESLNTTGFVGFASGLGWVLDGIVKETENLSSVTVLAPRDMGFEVDSGDGGLRSSALFGRVVRLHVLPERWSYADLAAMPKRASLRTLVGDSDVVVVDIGDGLNEIVAVNGVVVTDPEVLGGEGFVVHGIARCLVDVVAEVMGNASISAR